MQYPGTWDIPELYDLRKDPDQIQNLIAGARIGPRQRGRYVNHIQDPAVKHLVEGMQDRLEQLLAETGGDPRLSGKAHESDQYAL